MVARSNLKSVGIGIMLIALAVLMTTACASKKVTRVSSAEKIDLSGKWNDTDSQQVSREMIRDVLSAGWLKEWNRNSRKKPTVIAYAVSNRSSEHINTELFIKDLERAFINSARVRVVASDEQRDTIRGERAQQNVGFTKNPAAVGKELGADFVLTGSIGTIKDREGKDEVAFYQTNLELIGVESNEKVWIGEKKIKKVIERSKFGF